MYKSLSALLMLINNYCLKKRVYVSKVSGHNLTISDCIECYSSETIILVSKLTIREGDKWRVLDSDKK